MIKSKDYLNKIIQGDVVDVLKTLPDGIVQTVVTSPPYWGLRDYSVPGQFGLEKTPELYVEKMVAIFREIWRVLRDDGTVWLNLGDSYVNNSKPGGEDPTIGIRNIGESKYTPTKVSNLKPKDLCGIPWRVAFALQADGWYLRSDIIWSKKNPMPESVTDRPTKAHEYIFLLTKKPKYYYDADAIREDFNYPERRYNADTSNHKTAKLKEQGNRSTSALHDGRTQYGDPQKGRNRRTVWEITTQSYSEAHFATFPEKLVEPCILAGSPEKACGICGAPWARVTEKRDPERRNVKSDYPHNQTIATLKYKHNSAGPILKTLGFRPTCEHDNGESKSIVMDPFGGAGTVAKVALRANRNFILSELNQEYIDMAMKRIGPLLKQGILI